MQQGGPPPKDGTRLAVRAGHTRCLPARILGPHAGFRRRGSDGKRKGRSRCYARLEGVRHESLAQFFGEFLVEVAAIAGCEFLGNGVRDGHAFGDGQTVAHLAEHE